MAGKNTAAFGIFPSVARAEQAVDALIAAGLETMTFRSWRQTKKQHTNWRPKKTPRRPKEQLPALPLAVQSGAPSDCLPELGPLQFPALDHSLRPAPSWVPSQA